MICARPWHGSEATSSQWVSVNAVQSTKMTGRGDSITHSHRLWYARGICACNRALPTNRSTRLMRCLACAVDTRSRPNQRRKPTAAAADQRQRQLAQQSTSVGMHPLKLLVQLCQDHRVCTHWRLRCGCTSRISCVRISQLNQPTDRFHSPFCGDSSVLGRNLAIECSLDQQFL